MRYVRVALSLVGYDDAGNEVSRENFTSVNAVKKAIRNRGLAAQTTVKGKSACQPRLGGKCGGKSPYYHK